VPRLGFESAIPVV